jgi:ArsR family transcriptional regulator, arsenate/arsenite/antimonite-responsive transcriptional repressor
MRRNSPVEMARRFDALADDVRLALLSILREGKGTLSLTDLITALEQRVGRLYSKANVSHHINILLRAGLLEVRRHGTSMYYSLRPDAFGEMAIYLAPMALAQKVRRSV